MPDETKPAESASRRSAPDRLAEQFESALPESNEWYRRLFENYHAVMLLYDPESFTIVDANPAACQFYGYSRDQLTTLKITDLNGMTFDEATRDNQRAGETSLQPHFLTHHLANGETRDVESFASSIQIDGKTCQFSIVHDITQRKHAEVALEHERNFVSAVLDTVGALVVVLDREGRIVRFNRTCERLTGYCFAEIKDRLLWDFLLVPEEVPAVRQVFEQLRAGDFPFDFENYWVTREGRRRMIAWSNTALVSADGVVEYIIGTGIDVTDKQKAQQEIRHMSSFPLLNPNPVLEVDASGRVVFCNPSTYKVLKQLDLEEDAQLFLPKDILNIIATLEQRQASVAWREVTVGAAVFAENIHLASGFGTVRIFTSDITERKQIEEALRRSNAELQERNVELDAFAHTVAHDIKNPLHLIIGHADMLADNFASLSPAEVVESLQYIERSSQKLNRITDNLLLLSELRQKDVGREALSMAAIVSEARLRVAHLIDRQTDISVPEVWPIGLGYGPWVEEIWANLLSNALKYAGRPVRIDLGGERQPSGMVRFWIRDNGSGIVPADQARLFEVFYRAHLQPNNGHGLGLSIVKRIVERLGGEVSVQSSGVPGEGSVFSFTLPAV